MSQEIEFVPAERAAEMQAAYDAAQPSEQDPGRIDGGTTPPAESSGRLVRASDLEPQVQRLFEIDGEVDPDGKMSGPLRDAVSGIVHGLETIATGAGEEAGDAFDAIKAMAQSASDEVIAEAEAMLAETEIIGSEITAEARHLASEAVAEVKKVWNKNLQAWV